MRAASTLTAGSKGSHYSFPGQTRARRRHLGAAQLVPLLLVMLAAALPMQATPVGEQFQLPDPLLANALVSCTEISLRGGSSVDSAGLLTGAGLAEQGHVLANGDITLNGNVEVHGDATAGPSAQVSLTGQALVTGTTGNAEAGFDCHPIDLAALYSGLDAANDNDQIPLTGKGKDPLSGSAHRSFKLSANDTLTLPAGSYLFDSFSVQGGALLQLEGRVTILVTGEIKVTGGGELNPDGSPFDLRLWSSHDGRVQIDANVVVSAFVYAPDAEARLNGCEQLRGGIFANEINLLGGARVTRVIDDGAPTLVITEPSDGDIVSVCEIPVSGTVSDDETGVSLSINGEPVAVNADGSFTTMVSLWTDDPGLIVAVATDAAGNQTSESVRVSIVAPVVLLTAPAPGSLVGTRLIDLAGSSGTAAAITVNGQPALVDGGGWSLAGFDLGEQDGVVDLEVTGSNCGGSVSEPFTLDLDTLAPQITITSPEDGSVAASSMITVTGTVYDAHILSVVVNGIPATVSQQGTWVAEGVSVSEAWVTITATATDELLRSTSASIQVQGDRRGPVLSIDQPAAADGACLEAGQLYTIAGSYFDTNPAADGLQMQVYPVDGDMTSYPATLSDDAASWSVADVDLGADDGTATVTLVATDTVGNSAQVSRSWSLDAGAPEISITLDGEPFPGVVAGSVPQGDPVLLNRVVAPRVSVSDGPLTAPVPTLMLNGQPFTAGTQLSDEGVVYTLVATASDCAGHTSSVCAYFQIDRTAPELLSTVPDDAALVAEAVISYSGVADSELASARVNGSEATVTGTGFTLQELPCLEGANQVVIELLDAAGNQSSVSRSVTVRTTDPTVEILESGRNIADGAVYGRPITPVIRSNFDDNTIVATLDGAPYTSGEVVATAGDHTIEATATDPLDRSVTASVGFSIDLSDDPTIVITSLQDGDTVTSTKIDVSGTVTGSELSVTVNGEPATVNGSSFSISELELEPEAFSSIVAMVTDRRGRVAAHEVVVRVQTDAPQVVILEPADGVLTNRSRIDLAGVVVGNLHEVVGGVVTVAGTEIPLAADGAWRAVDVPLSEGSNLLVAEARSIRVGSAGEEVIQVGQMSVEVIADMTPPLVLVQADGQAMGEGASFLEPPAIEVVVSDSGSEPLAPQVSLNGVAIAATGPTVSVAIDADGGYVLVVVAEDGAGNQARLERAFTVGVSACSLIDIEPASGSAFAAGAVTIRGRSATAAGVEVRLVSQTDPSQYQEWPASVADGTFLAGDVPLAEVGENRIDLVCTSAGVAGEPVTLLLERLPDGSGPVVEITAPPANQLLASDGVTVQGTVSDSSAAVTVNGVDALVDEMGAFTATLTLAEGPNIIVARARDAANRSGRDRIVVQRDTEPPQVQITNPESNTWLGVGSGGATIEVTGVIDQATEPNLQSLVLSTEPSGDSVAVTPHPDLGTFSATLTLDASAGGATPQTITATASDSLGHVGTSSVTVYLDTGGPAIVLGGPADLSRYGEGVSEVTISGQAWGAGGTRVAINGTTLQLTDQQWQDAGDGRFTASFSTTVTVPDDDGAFGVIAVATDLDGRSARDRRLLYRDTTPPTVIDMVPVDGSTGVDRDSLLMVLLSEPVQPASLAPPDGLVLTRSDGGDMVVGEVVMAGNAVAFVSGAALEPGAAYTFTAGTGITDLAGNPLLATAEHPNQASFTVAETETGAAPQIGDIQVVGCTELVVSGSAAPSSGVRVRDGKLSFMGYADEAGHFEISVLLTSGGYHLLHLSTVDGLGNQVGAEATASVLVDCTHPTVSAAAFDRSTGVITLVFSEEMDLGTATIGGAADSLRLRDADAPPGTYETGTVAAGPDSHSIEIRLDTSAEAWWRERPVRLEVGPPLADSNGNAMQGEHVSLFLPGSQGQVEGGFLFGEAFDDSTGRPLADARVRLFPSGAVLPGSTTTIADAVAETTTTQRGRYTLVTTTGSGDIAAGRYVTVIEHEGYTRVVRRLALAPATGAVPFDSRLTPLAEPAGSIDPLSGGSVSHPQQPLLAVTAEPGALPGSDPLVVRLTPLSGQGLVDFLPLGWTPVAAAELRLELGDDTLPEVPETGFAAGDVRLQLPLPDWVLPGDELIAVQYRLTAGVWLTLGTVERLDGSNGEPLARCALPGPGTVVLVLADEDEATRPPIPTAAGEILFGVSLPDQLPELAAEMSVDPPVIAPTGRALVRAVARSADLSTPWPAGMAVQAFLDERLTLASGEELVEAPFSADLVVYHPRLTSEERDGASIGSSGAMELMVAPSERASKVLLDVGYESIRLYPFPEQVERGNVLGPTGGSVSSTDGVELVIPEGALPAKTVVDARLLSDDELAGLPEVAGFDTLAGISIDLSGESLARPATLRLLQPTATPDAIAGDPRLVLAELIEDPGDGLGSLVKLAARLGRSGDGEVTRLEAAPEPADSLLVLDGIIREGTYLVLWAQEAIGYAGGFVRAANGAPVAASRVAAAGLGSGDLSAAYGRYAAVVRVAAPQLAARHPVRDEVGWADVTGLTPGSVAAVDIVVEPVAPELTGYLPADGAENVIVGTQVSLSFSEPLDEASVSASTVALEIEGRSGGGSGAFIIGDVELVDPSTIVFTPSAPLPHGRVMLVHFSGSVRDTGGTYYQGGPLSWSFTVAEAPPAGGTVDPSKFHAEMPTEDGTVRVFGLDGAVPGAGWLINPYVKREITDDTQGLYATSVDNGSFDSVTFGVPPNQPVTISDEIWVKVWDPANNLAEHFRIETFTSADGKGFVARPGEAISFGVCFDESGNCEDSELVTVDVPAGAFDVPTMVRVEQGDLGELEGLHPPGMGMAGYVRVKFDGMAHETLRLKLPAPADIDPDADVFIGKPISTPMGKKLQIISYGGVLQEGENYFVSNHPSLQAEPPPDVAGKCLLQRSETKDEETSLCDTGIQTCDDYRKCCKEYDEAINSGNPTCPIVSECCRKIRIDTVVEDGRTVSIERGLSQCFVRALFMEMLYETDAVFFYEMGVQWAMMTGPAGSWAFSVGFYNYYFYNLMADWWYYLPKPYDWDGRYAFPVMEGEPITIGITDAATGWLLTELPHNPITADDGFFIAAGPFQGDKPTPPMITGGTPMDFITFRTPAKDEPILLHLGIEAVADQDEDERATGKVRLRAVPEFELADGTWMELWDMAPALVEPTTATGDDNSDDGEEPAPPIRGPNLTIDGNGDSWELPAAMQQSESLRLVLGRGDHHASRLTTFELQFDQPLDPAIEKLDPKKVVELKDLGPTDDKSTDGRLMPVEISLAARDSRLVIRPLVRFSPGHSYTLELIDPEQIKSKESGTSYWSDDITKFEFATRKIGGGVVCRTNDGDVSNLHANAWDQLKLGNLLMVAEGNGKLQAIDVSSYDEPDSFKIHATMVGSAKPIRSLATDGHNRLFMSLQLGSTWALKTVRMEDVRSTPAGGFFEPVVGGIKLGYGSWYYASVTASEYQSAHAFPAGTPLDLKVLVQDEMLEPEDGIDLEEFYEKYAAEDAQEFSELEPDEEGLYEVEVVLESSLARETIDESFRTEHCASDEPWDRYQRVTVDNLTTGQSWSFDIANPWGEEGGAGTYNLTVRAHREDRLRVRYNLHAIGYVAMMGSGILVVDLNRGYRHVPKLTPAEQRRQCGELMGVFEGAHMSFPPEADRSGNPPNGLEWTTAVTAHTWTGFENDEKNPLRGKGDINIYSPLKYVGLVHTRSPDTTPGDISAESVQVIKEVWPERKKTKPDGSTENKPTWFRVTTEDVALANNATWIDHGLRGSVVWEDMEYNEEQITINNIRFRDENGDSEPKEQISDLLFASLGLGGVAVFDVSDRSLNELIGHLFYKNHVIQRVQVDDVRGLLYAGGYDEVKGWLVDVWDIRAVNAQPDPDNDPEPLLTIFGFPWKTRNLAVDSGGLNMLYTWTSTGRAVAIPQDKVSFHMRGLYLPEEDAENPLPPEGERRPSVEKLTEQFVPIGIPLEHTAKEEKDNRDANERKATAAFKVRVTLPGSFGPELTAKVQTLRMLPDERYLGQEDVGAAVALPGGPGWPKRDVVVTLRRVGVDEDEDVPDSRIFGEDGKFGTAYNLYESKETVIMLADPRARREYRRQELPENPDNDDADEESQCRRCGYPSYLPDPEEDPDDPELEDVKELLAGGPYVRIFLYAEDDPPPPDPGDPEPPEDPGAQAREDTREAIEFFKRTKKTYPLPYGIAKLVAWADAVPSPVQVTGKEPALSPASWSPGEAGVSVSLTTGDAILNVVDAASAGRKQVIAVDRNYRSGTLGYGPLGSGGWHSTLYAHLREIQTTGEVEYHDGTGQVWRFLPREDKDTEAPDGYELDKLGSYHVPDGLFLRLQRLPAGAGWRMLDSHHNGIIFDAQGHIAEVSDRLRRGKTDIEEQGNSLVYHYDLFGQLIAVEDEWGRTYSFEYYDDPSVDDEEERARYGLLKKVEHFVDGRTIEYRYTEDRLLERVRLPEVRNSTDAYSGFSYTGESRPTLSYRYESSVDSSEESTTAILHGKFAELRLAGYELPDFGFPGTERLKLQYHEGTGKLKEVIFPGPYGGDVTWQVGYGGLDSAGPSSQAEITSPWQQLTTFTIESGRATEIKEVAIETLGRDDDGSGGEWGGKRHAKATAKDLVTTFEYVDVAQDGRLHKVTYPDQSSTSYSYADEGKAEGISDFLTKLNVKAVTETSEGGDGKSDPLFVTELFDYDVDNFPKKTNDSYNQETLSRAPTPGETGIQVGQTQEGVTATRDDDLWGRATTILFDGGGTGKADDPTIPMQYTFSFKDHGDQVGGGLLEKVSAGSGEVIWEEYEYDDETDNLTQRSSSFGSLETYVYDDWDRAVEVTTGQAGASDYEDASTTVQRAYDAAGHLVRERFQKSDSEWVETRYEYNAREQIVEVIETNLAPPEVDGGLLEGTTYYAYQPADGLLDTVTSPAGIVTQYQLDNAGRIASVQVGESGVQERQYDELGRLVYTTDGDEGVWRGKYNYQGKLDEEVLPTGVRISREFNPMTPAGEHIKETVFSATDTRLQETRTHIDGLGQVELIEEVIISPDGAETLFKTDYEYDSNGRAFRVSTCDSGSTESRVEAMISYDGAGRVTSVEDAVGNLTDYLYAHEAPWPDEITFMDKVPSGQSIRHTLFARRDVLGRVLEVDVDGTTMVREYDKAGNLIKLERMNNILRYAYDGRGNLMSTERQATGQMVRHGYDLDGRLVKTSVDRDGSIPPDVTTYSYDSSGRMQTRKQPGDATLEEVFDYYPDNTLKQWQTRYSEGARLIIDYEYDKANRLLERKTNAGAFDPENLPKGLAPVDYGDVYTYDALSRPLSVAVKTGSDSEIDESTRVVFSRYDSRGLAEHEQVGTRPVLQRAFDSRGRLQSVLLPAGLGGDTSVPGFAFQYDALDRPELISAATASGGPSMASPLRAELSWGGVGRLYGITTYGPANVSYTYHHDEVGARLSGLGLAAAGRQLAGFSYTWDISRDLRSGRSVQQATPPALNLTASMGWSWTHDVADRLKAAESDQGVGNGSQQGKGLSWDYGYGMADELLSITSSTESRHDFDSGLEGRIESRKLGDQVLASFDYDDEGRRIEDDRNDYRYTWRGDMVQVDVKDDAPAHAGERVRYRYDAAGRLLERTHIGKIPENGGENDRPFISARQFVWDGAALAAEVGLNFQGAIIWRKQYLPGPSGLDDAPLIRVQTNLNGGTPTDTQYAFLRDELGTVIGFIEDSTTEPGKPPKLLARYLYTPYGEAHIELGPELTAISFDPEVSEVAGQPQDPPIEEETVGGALRVVTTLPLAPESYDEGIILEVWDPTELDWAPESHAAYVIGRDGEDPSQLLIMRQEGWLESTLYRIRLISELRDEFDRRMQLPPLEVTGVEALLAVPVDATEPPVFNRTFQLIYDNVQAAETTFEGAIPGGQTALFQGLWTDPVTGINYARNRWYDARNANWLSEDSLGVIDSPNLFAFVGWGPNSYTDPEGLASRIKTMIEIGKWLAKRGHKAGKKLMTHIKRFAGKRVTTKMLNELTNIDAALLRRIEQKFPNLEIPYDKNALIDFLKASHDGAEKLTLDSVNIGKFSSNYQKDISEAWKQFAKDHPDLTKAQLTDLKNRYRMHHEWKDGMLVPVEADVHEAFRHTGAEALRKAGFFMEFSRAVFVAFLPETAKSLQRRDSFFEVVKSVGVDAGMNVFDFESIFFLGELLDALAMKIGEAIFNMRDSTGETFGHALERFCDPYEWGGYRMDQ